MFLSMPSFYTNSYSQSNTYSYSTVEDAKSHNLPMNYREWLSNQLAEIGATPTDLSRVIDGDLLNQPTIQRILKGKTPNPRIGTVKMIEKALTILGSRNPKYYQDASLFIDGESRRVEEIDPIPALTVPFQSARDRQINELVTLARSMSDEGLSIAIYESKKIAEQYPAQAKQTPGSFQ